MKRKAWLVGKDKKRKNWLREVQLWGDEDTRRPNPSVKKEGRERRSKEGREGGREGVRKERREAGRAGRKEGTEA